MKYERLVVSPEQAKTWLSSNANNRKIQRWYVNLYERALTAGRWHETHQGIAFGVDGALVDGQHRLAAIVGSGIAAVLWVATGLTKEAVMAIDQGRRRSLSDALRWSLVTLSSSNVATLRVIEYGQKCIKKSIKISPDELLDLAEKHSAALAFTNEHIGSRHLRGMPAFLCGLVGRASYTHDHAALVEFCNVMRAGDTRLATRPSGSLIKLRDMLRSEHDTLDGRLFKYMKSARVLRAFIEGQVIDKIYADMDPDKTFPIPSGN